MGSVTIADMGSYFVGGKKVTVEGGEPIYAKLVDGWKEPKKFSPDGDYQAGQMYVQYVRLSKPLSPYPVCLIHGGGLCGTMWERTLDDKPGWMYRLLENGYHVNVSDGADRGRSPWARYPEINKQPAFFRNYEEAWTTFRLGEKYPEPFDGIRFDLSKFEYFMKQQVPRFPGGIATSTADSAYADYFEKLSDDGGHIILAYSEGGLFALRAALKFPKNIKALILVESTSTMDVDTTDISCLNGIPVLHIWGDYIGEEYINDHYSWAAAYAYNDTMRRFHERLLAIGGDSTWIHLPEIGIANNTHALIAEDNSYEILDVILNWLHERGL